MKNKLFATVWLGSVQAGRAISRSGFFFTGVTAFVAANLMAYAIPTDSFALLTAIRLSPLAIPPLLGAGYYFGLTRGIGALKERDHSFAKEIAQSLDGEEGVIQVTMGDLHSEGVARELKKYGYAEVAHSPMAERQNNSNDSRSVDHLGQPQIMGDVTNGI